jgi:hypothetical protein
MADSPVSGQTLTNFVDRDAHYNIFVIFGKEIKGTKGSRIPGFEGENRSLTSNIEHSTSGIEYMEPSLSIVGQL